MNTFEELLCPVTRDNPRCDQSHGGTTFFSLNYTRKPHHRAGGKRLLMAELAKQAS